MVTNLLRYRSPSYHFVLVLCLWFVIMFHCQRTHPVWVIVASPNGLRFKIFSHLTLKVKQGNWLPATLPIAVTSRVIGHSVGLVNIMSLAVYRSTTRWHRAMGSLLVWAGSPEVSGASLFLEVSFIYKQTNCNRWWSELTGLSFVAMVAKITYTLLGNVVILGWGYVLHHIVL